jgi:hypothetical protein
MNANANHLVASAGAEIIAGALRLLRFGRLAAFALALCCQATIALAADPPDSTVIARRATIAGELTIAQLGDDWANGPFRIALGGRTVLETDNDKPVDGMPIPTILTGFRDGLAPYDEIVVLQQNTAGNACNGGPIWFLGIRKSGAFAVTKPIDFCGGADPVIERKGARIILTFPGGQPNHGTERVPTEVWVFEAGVAKQLK